MSSERVRKLLAKARDPGCTPEEARAYEEKAVELIVKYGIKVPRVQSAAHKTRVRSVVGGFKIYCSCRQVDRRYPVKDLADTYASAHRFYSNRHERRK